MLHSMKAASLRGAGGSECSVTPSTLLKANETSSVLLPANTINSNPLTSPLQSSKPTQLNVCRVLVSHSSKFETSTTELLSC